MSAVFKLMTVAEVAAELRCCPKQVRRLIANGALPTLRLGLSGKSDRVHPDDLAGFIARGRRCHSRNAETPGRSLSAGAVRSIVDRAVTGAVSRRPRLRGKSSTRSTTPA